jgi:quercetin dioxygenase-like cupin family protein
MKIKKFDEIEVRPYPSDKAKNAVGRVAIGKAEGAENYCMRILQVNKAGNTAFHSHDFEHEVFIHQGVGQVFGNGKWHDFKAGDVMFIPSNEEHQFKNTGEEPVLFVCVIPSGPPEM